MTVAAMAAAAEKVTVDEGALGASSLVEVEGEKSRRAAESPTPKMKLAAWRGLRVSAQLEAERLLQ